MKQFPAVVFCSTIVVTTFTFARNSTTQGQETKVAPTHPSQIRVVLVGDSTVTDKAGWGGAFGKLFDEHVECLNLAAGGRSSLSFRTEGRWQKCLELKPDYVLIQFGHNDQPGKGPERETEPETTYRKYMESYVREARQAGIRPILVTSLTRRRLGENGKIQSTLVPYVEVVKQIAKHLEVPLVDLHALSIQKCEALGPEGCQSISPTTAEGRIDQTHLNEAGAKLIAPLIAAEIRKVVPALGEHFRKESSTQE